MRLLKNILLGSLLLSLVQCGGGTTGGTETGNPQSTIGAAIGALFGSRNKSALRVQPTLPTRLVQLLIQTAEAASQNHTACDPVTDNPSGVTTSNTITAGSYGISTNSITVTAANGCDQGGEFASFTISSHTLACTDSKGNSSSVTMTKSTGVFRENATLNATQIYGNFNLASGSSSSTRVACSFVITNPQQGHGTGQFSGSCEDSQGNPITQTTDTTCSDQ